MMRPDVAASEAEEGLMRMQNAFRAEAHGLLSELDSALLELEAEPGDASLVQRVFRALHTLKGAGATLGLVHLATFAGGMAAVFDLARAGRLAVTPEMTDAGLKACEVLRLIIDQTTGPDAVVGELDASATFARLAQPQPRAPDERADAVASPGFPPDEAFALFLAECDEHLDDLERDALRLEQRPDSKDDLASLFRAVHSIKGNAGLLLAQVAGDGLAHDHPLQLLLRVTHNLESQLDPCRSATEAVPAATIQAALDARDTIRTLLTSLTERVERSRMPAAPAPRPILDAVSPTSLVAGARQAAFLSTTSQCIEVIDVCLGRLDTDGTVSSSVLEAYQRGLTAWSAAARHADHQELVVPLAAQQVTLASALDRGAVLNPGDRLALANAFRTARAVVERLTLTPGTPREASVAATALAPVDQPVPAGAERRDASVADRRDSPGSPATIRIDQDKLDRLMRIVGELLVARGALPLLVQKLQHGADPGALVKDLKEAGSSVSRIADELQRSVMSIRMLPVKTVFQRFPRLVRDLARSLGKDVRLELEGEGIELDKTILEQIGDPLVHLIRNAVDHGLESPEDRRTSGKDPTGRLLLRAVHEAGGVAIEVTEDGRGLDAGALKRKAIDKGLLTAEAAAAMSDEAAFQLVFLPGLTTAVKLTDVSGRGVGMDVVRSNVRSLHGSVDIRSTRGKGTTFMIRLPASLMISKGILLEAGGQEYILPLSNIRDMVKLPAQDLHEYRGQHLAQVRGTVYPVLGLAAMLGLIAAPATELSIAIIEAGASRYGLLVDRFVTEVEVLVKPLAGGLEQCVEFQGAALMGDGRVVLVLNALGCLGMERTA